MTDSNSFSVFPKNMEDLISLFEQVKDHCRKAGLPIQESNLKINVRLKRSLGRCCKQTSSKNQEFFLIEVSSLVLEMQNISLLRNVLAHELIHTIPGCYNHSTHFHQAAQKLNSYHLKLYAVKVKYNLAEYGLFYPNSPSYLYAIVCTQCQYTLYRQRMSKTLRHIERYCCPKCQGSLRVYPLNSKSSTEAKLQKKS